MIFPHLRNGLQVGTSLEAFALQIPHLMLEDFVFSMVSHAGRSI